MPTFWGRVTVVHGKSYNYWLLSNDCTVQYLGVVSTIFPIPDSPHFAHFRFHNWLIGKNCKKSDHFSGLSGMHISISWFFWSPICVIASRNRDNRPEIMTMIFDLIQTIQLFHFPYPRTLSDLNIFFPNTVIKNWGAPPPPIRTCMGKMRYLTHYNIQCSLTYWNY